MQAKTLAAMNAMVDFAREGNEVIPMYSSECGHGKAAVSAAIRVAKKRGLLVECGKDGCGCPKYAAPIPAATHVGTQVAQ